jgi:hypothetical protein
MEIDVLIEKLNLLILGWNKSAQSKERTANALYNKESIEYKALQFAASTQYHCAFDLKEIVEELQNKRLNNDN